MACRKKTYGFAPMALFVLIAAGAVFIPIFIFGMGATVRGLQFIFSPVTEGSIPIWAVFVIGIIAIKFIKGRRSY